MTRPDFQNPDTMLMPFSFGGPTDYFSHRLSIEPA
jgi:hypothetical protein